MQIPNTTIEYFELLSLLFLLYAEIHYSLPGIYSRLKHKTPEIIADIPHRLEPGKSMPVLILVKDGNRYPVYLQKVEIKWHSDHKEQCRQFVIGKSINRPIWHTIIEIPPEDLPAANILVDVLIYINCTGKSQIIKNDNYKTTSHAPFQVLVSPYFLPKKPGWHYGEFHCHTSYTNDQVEFGAPLAATRHLAATLGLDFLCATDHSYDLDDEPDDYLKKDPELKKWHALRREVFQLNRDHPGFVVVPGEEVSAGNSKGQNVHFLILNNPEFLPGHGDGAEHWLQTRPTTLIRDVLKKTNSNSGAFAAHPEIQPPLLERLLVRRGTWQKEDYLHPGLHGLQIWNGSDMGFEEGKKVWINLLLTGRKIYIAAGNDAHGNFNRFRQVKFPFLSLQENHHNLFGKIRTTVYLEKPFTLDNLLHAIKRGNMVLTNGPFVCLEIFNNEQIVARCGDSVCGEKFVARITAVSSPEFGPLHTVKIFRGSPGLRQEEVIRTICDFNSPFDFSFTYEPEASDSTCYLRVEGYSAREGEVFKCLTNPVWFKKKLPGA